MFHPRNETDTFQPSPSNRSFLTSLTITQDGKDNASTFKPLAGQVDESYELAVTMDGKSTIKAHSSIGILRALETFTQLFYTGYYADKKKEYYTPYVPVKIEDGPKYHYRGLMLDTSRNFYPVESMFRTIDGCAASKLNTLHWHITDAQVRKPLLALVFSGWVDSNTGRKLIPNRPGRLSSQPCPNYQLRGHIAQTWSTHQTT